ncbi:MAG: CoA transferase [Gammaproteobacteria bacterium]|nr:CoA transferase [Gammaproteobacteria bacterium]
MARRAGEPVSGALRGLRVLEVGQLIAGPFCGQLLADLGAEVIKIELPGQGDPMREWGRGAPVWWPVIGRNKKCITLDVRNPRGLALMKELAACSDVLLENFRPGTLERWGLDYSTLSAINPRLVLVRVSGYGQDGPYASRAGYGGIGEAMGGLRYVCGDPAVPPSRVGISIGDSLAAMFACIGCLAALQQRERSGAGQVVDSAIYESVLAVMESTVPEYTVGGVIRERHGSVLPGIAPSNVYPTTDGQLIVMGANQDSVFRRLCEVMGRPELADDARYCDHAARAARQRELDDLIAAWSRQHAVEPLLALLEEAGVPAGRMFRAPDMLADPQYRARQSIVRVAHEKFQDLMMQNVFPRLSVTPGEIRWPGAAMGAHNDDVFGGLLGLDTEALASLRAEGVI